MATGGRVVGLSLAVMGFGLGQFAPQVFGYSGEMADANQGLVLKAVHGVLQGVSAFYREQIFQIFESSKAAGLSLGDRIKAVEPNRMHELTPWQRALVREVSREPITPESILARLPWMVGVQNGNDLPPHQRVEIAKKLSEIDDEFERLDPEAGSALPDIVRLDVLKVVVRANKGLRSEQRDVLLREARRLCEALNMGWNGITNAPDWESKIAVEDTPLSATRNSWPWSLHPAYIRAGLLPRYTPFGRERQLERMIAASRGQFEAIIQKEIDPLDSGERLRYSQTSAADSMNKFDFEATIERVRFDEARWVVKKTPKPEYFEPRSKEFYKARDTMAEIEAYYSALSGKPLSESALDRIIESAAKEHAYGFSELSIRNRHLRPFYETAEVLRARYREARKAFKMFEYGDNSYEKAFAIETIESIERYYRSGARGELPEGLRPKTVPAEMVGSPR